VTKSNLPTKALGIFALAMINVAAVLSLRNFPSMAEYGWSSVGWYLIGTIFFLIPLSLAGAELATGWPKGGGVYAWVREAFGERWGFLAVWCEWSENLVWFPTVLSFIAATFAYCINPALGSNTLFLFIVMFGVFWGITILNFFGARASSIFGTIGLFAGSIIPTILLVVMSVFYITTGQPLQIAFTPAALLPDINLGTLPFIATVILLFAGMEMAGYHATETKNPKRDFPRAIFLSALIILVATVLGTLAIAFVVPVQQINLAAGIMQAFVDFFKVFNIEWMIGPIAVLIAIGAVAQLSTWILGPAKGLGEVAARGNLPPLFQKDNRFGAPVAVLIIQAVIGSLFSLLFIFLPSVSGAYWILSAMTVEVLCVMYLLIFAAVIKLRYSQPDTPRAYRIPGGKPGIWIIAGVGFIACTFSFIIGFFPPSTITTGDIGLYFLIMILGTIILVCPPFIFLLFKKSNWLKTPSDNNAVQQ
jgi:putative glutamate/gamma-aminobutyrate antiporter